MGLVCCCRYAATAFCGSSTADPWNTVRPFILQFNNHYSKILRHGRYLCMDELMSPFRPRADKFGGLPQLTFVERKPQPYGNEFKDRCTADGICDYLELQEGKAPMEKLLLPGLKSKASGALRLCTNAQRGASQQDLRRCP